MALRHALRMLAVASCAALAACASRDVVANPAVSWGTWEGWGVSLCWWPYSAFGESDALADAVFTTASSVTLGLDDGSNASVPGLGFNIARFTAGGSSNTPANGVSMHPSPNAPWWKQTAGFWTDPSQPDPAQWDWQGDAATNMTSAHQLSMLKKAIARGAIAQLFSNSPMWWALTNLDPSGSDSGSSDNLNHSALRAHAHYMAGVASHFDSALGIKFSSVEPFNEPIATWWRSSGTQEGCHFDASTQAALLPMLRQELDGFGLTDVDIAASDESFVDMAVATWRAFNASVRAVVAQVDVHGYQFDKTQNRSTLYREAVLQAGKRLWTSEYGEGDGTGAQLLLNINLDFQELHPTAWVYWQVIDVAGGWGLLYGDIPSGWALHAVNTKWYVLAQFSRHIRAGMEVIGSAPAPGAPVGANATTVIARDTTAPRGAANVVVIQTNLGSSAANVAIDLSSLGSCGPVSGGAGLADRWVTTATAAPTMLYTHFQDVAVSNSVFVAACPPSSVSTFEFHCS